MLFEAATEAREADFAASIVLIEVTAVVEWADDVMVEMVLVEDILWVVDDEGSVLVGMGDVREEA